MWYIIGAVAMLFVIFPISIIFQIRIWKRMIMMSNWNDKTKSTTVASGLLLVGIFLCLISIGIKDRFMWLTASFTVLAGIMNFVIEIYMNRVSKAIYGNEESETIEK